MTLIYIWTLCILYFGKKGTYYLEEMYTCSRKDIISDVTKERGKTTGSILWEMHPIASVTFKRHEEILTSERVERERDVRIAETWPSTTLQDVRTEQYLWEHIARNQAHRYRARQCPKAICGLPVHFMHKRDVTWKHNCTLLIEGLLISSKYHPAGILFARTKEKFMSIILSTKFHNRYIK